MDPVRFYRGITRSDMTQVIALLQNISKFDPDLANYDQIWADYSQQGHVFTLVAHREDGLVLGFGALVVEKKIRGGSLGHIEDIVTHQGFRGQGIGRTLIAKLTEIALEKECYKVALHCRDNNALFYEHCGFEASGSSMQKIL